MTRPPPNYETPLAYQIEVGLQEIATAPDSLPLHQKLRAIALRYKSQGGPSVGMIQRMKLPPREPVQRLLHIERLWSLDPGNLDFIPKILAAIAAVEQQRPSDGFEDVRRWLYRILETGASGV